MPSLKKIVSAVLSPLLYLNLAGMTAAALWLGVLGQWQVMGIGVMMVFFSPYIIPLLLLPAGFFSRLMVLFGQMQKPGVERAMLACSLGYIVAFMTFWCTYIFDLVTHAVVPAAAFAAMLFANAAAVGPLLWWVSKDRENIFIITMVEMTQVGMLALLALRLLQGNTTFWPTFAIFAALLALVAGAQLLYEKRALKKVS